MKSGKPIKIVRKSLKPKQIEQEKLKIEKHKTQNTT
jgi:hypothetical protein